jgi:hypothetical protein
MELIPAAKIGAALIVVRGATWCASPTDHRNWAIGRACRVYRPGEQHRPGLAFVVVTRCQAMRERAPLPDREPRWSAGGTRPKSGEDP